MKKLLTAIVVSLSLQIGAQVETIRVHMGGGVRMGQARFINAEIFARDNSTGWLGLSYNFHGRFNWVVSPVTELGFSYGKTLNAAANSRRIDAAEIGFGFRKFTYRKTGSFAPVGVFWGLEGQFYKWTVTNGEGFSSSIGRSEASFLVPFAVFGRQGLAGNRFLYSTSMHFGAPVFAVGGASTQLLEEAALKWGLRFHWQLGCSYAF